MSLRFALLALLSKEPNSGYGLQRLLRGTLSHLWDARLQQIYADLARAQDNGLVDVRLIDLANRPAKKVYTLTTAGEDLLDGWLADRTDPFVPKDALPHQAVLPGPDPSGTAPSSARRTPGAL